MGLSRKEWAIQKEVARCDQSFCLYPEGGIHSESGNFLAKKISTSEKIEKKSESVAIASTTIKQNKSIPVVSEAQFEQVMAGLSYTEIADVGNGAEQDVYLDLYN